VDGEAVVAPLVDEQVEDREQLGRNSSGRCGWNQASTCRSGTARPGQEVEQLLVPGPGRDDEAVGLVDAAVVWHADALVAERLPALDLLAAVDLGAVAHRLGGVGDDAALGTR
jgi:hypothetical protein